MEDLLTLIYILLVVFLLLVVFVMPIVAVILSLLTRRKLNQRLARIEAAHGLSPTQVGQATTLAQLEARLKRLETLVSGAVPPPVTEVVTPPP